MAMRADRAFVRVVKLQRSKGLPLWETAAEAQHALADGSNADGQAWRNVLTSRQVDQLRIDLALLQQAFGSVPWQHAAQVPVAKKKGVAR